MKTRQPLPRVDKERAFQKKGWGCFEGTSKNHLLQPREGRNPLPAPSPETPLKTNTRVMVGFPSLGSFSQGSRSRRVRRPVPEQLLHMLCVASWLFTLGGLAGHQSLITSRRRLVNIKFYVLTNSLLQPV